MDVLLYLILSSSPLYAQEEHKDINYQEFLDEAIRFYHADDRNSAMQKLLSLSYNKEAPQELRLEASIYIGEIMYIQGDKESAQRIFTQVLKQDPSYRIDPFRHPPNVCTFFNFVKSFVSIPPPPPPPPEKTLPMLAYSPFGVYHIQYGSPWKGYAYLSTQTISAATSIGLLIYLNGNNTYIEGDLARKAQLENLIILQRGSTVVFYSLWFTSIIESRQHFDLKLRSSEDASSMLPYLEWKGSF